MKYLSNVVVIVVSLVFIGAYNSTNSELSVPLKNIKDTVTGIHFFKGTWQEAVEKAKKERKLIFVDAYSAWCGPCRWMDSSAFKNPDVGKFFNDNFICVKIDCHKGEGKVLSKEWTIKAYPTMLCIDAKKRNLKIKKRFEGAIDADYLLNLGKAWAKL